MVILLTASQYATNPDYVKYTDSLKASYCRTHNITYLRIYNNTKHPDSHPVWDKIPKLIGALYMCDDIENDWVVWMDADAAPLNMGVSIAEHLKKYPRKIVMAKDINGWNAGVFAIPAGARSIRFLNEVQALRTDPNYANNAYREQSAMGDLFDGAYSDYVVEPDPSFGFNNYMDLYGQGDKMPNKFTATSWCLHIPGAVDAARNMLFQKFYTNMTLHDLMVH